MNAHVQQLLDQVRQLTDEDRLELLIAIEDEFGETEMLAEDAEWQAEIARRVAAVDSGESVCIPWEEVRQRLKIKHELPGDEP